MVLSDDEIKLALQGPNPLVRGVERIGAGKASQVQSSSLDLSVGGIYLPETIEPAAGSLGHPLPSLRLKAGQTAVVQTKESLDLPNNVAAIGFPPAGVSSRGLLMTNPGHVDPGYKGPLTFTVINMAKQDFHLVENDRIVTMLFFNLAVGAVDGWTARNDGKPGDGVTSGMLDVLSSDFVNVNERADAIATTRVRREGLKVVLVTFAVTVLTIVASILPTYLLFLDRSGEDRSRMARIETQANQLQSQAEVIRELESRLSSLEGRVAAGPNP